MARAEVGGICSDGACSGSSSAITAHASWKLVTRGTSKALAGTCVLIRAFALERVTGIEPALSAWEADVLPLNYTRSGTTLPEALHPRAVRCTRHLGEVAASAGG